MGQRGPTGCAGMAEAIRTRREALRAGGLALGGLALDGLFRLREARGASPAKAPGRAKACILIFQWGGPSQLDTWDPKPDAPADVRGPFRAIETSVPGVRIGEHFPMLAARAHRLAIIRSMGHDDLAHLSSVHRLQTGHLAPRPKSDADGPSPADWPHLGSVVGKVRPRGGVLPPAVILPWTVAHPAAPGGKAPGQHAGWLGKAHDPFLVEGDPNAPGFVVGGLGLPEGVSMDRLRHRRRMLGEIGESPGSPTSGRGAGGWDGFQARALDALGSAEARGAFDLEREDPRLRDRYGRHIHGQCLLMARRLVEAGVALVTVNWHDDGQNYWDTHGNNFERLKNDLMPPADRGFAALLDDLESRGMLDETLVVWVGEFGRAPRINRAAAGREHWARCYSGVLAGGGTRGGIVHGASDRWAAYPALDPVSPEDLGATILQAMGIDPAGEILDPLGRPLRLSEGDPLTSLFG
jgi:hypothetical protein